MKHIVLISVFLVLVVGCSTTNPTETTSIDTKLETATFAGGCFWCMESAFENYGSTGIYEVISGYAGGEEANPTYAEVSSGATGHREAIQVHYDPNIISYEELLDIFWHQINPTDDQGQYVDRGFQYTSAIFYHNEEQKVAAEASKKAWEELETFGAPILTPILEFTTFYEAEAYHQNYHTENPIRYNFYTGNSGRKEYLGSVWGEE